MDAYWAAIEKQLEEMRTAKTAQDVIDILNRPGSPCEPSSGDAFFGGEGGEVADALDDAGWGTRSYEAEYYWVMKAPDGSLLTYVEGDVYLGDQMLRS